MDAARIAALLAPYLGGHSLTGAQLAQLAAYLDLLQRWNARINLTAVRDPDQVVTRHFGESLFAARRLYPEGRQLGPGTWKLFDLGSGAGFPGMPIKIWAPALHATLLESNQRKATFLRELVRALQLTDVEILALRAEEYASESKHELNLVDAREAREELKLVDASEAREELKLVDVREVKEEFKLVDAREEFKTVGPGALAGAGLDSTENDVARAPSPATDVTITLRAVERFQQILPTALHLLQQFPDASRRLALLIGAAQVETARSLASTLAWSDPLLLPESSQRVLLIGSCKSSNC